ncbi:hypothetical protein AV540_22860 [Brevibacillus parabrevis]|uniref:hypothetical protein n=1 Tax=Brevibacillus parabrevis TaxID=54914 RepID=UPI0007AB9123|nr:hypothetical protein [Brevibacillus parabrevis]KZE45010.1 hypothetical protein AV540_22860 [Brevibacillus parabrevis]
MTNLSATVDPSVTKVEVYQGIDMVVDKVLSNETTYTDTVVGVTAGEVLTFKFYVGGTVVQSSNVTVQ